MPRTGRPTKYFRTNILEYAESLSALGFTKRELCTFLHISPDTLNRWEKQHPELAEAIDSGQLKANNSVAKRLYDKAIEGNMTAIVFWLTNRCSELWSDRRAFVQNNIVNNAQKRTNGNFVGEDRDLSERLMEALRKKLEE